MEDINTMIEALDALYKRYGYDINKKNINLRIYLYKKARYFGADIIPLKSTDEIPDLEKIKTSYQNLGFAVNVKNYHYCPTKNFKRVS